MGGLGYIIQAIHFFLFIYSFIFPYQAYNNYYNENNFIFHVYDCSTKCTVSDKYNG